MNEHPYLTAKETGALISESVQPDWRRLAEDRAAVIEEAWREVPDDLREQMIEHGSSLAGAIHAMRERNRK
jgi:hypothetical protein